MTDSINFNSPQLDLGKLKDRQIIANFEGGRITSDAGIVLMAQLDKKLRITSQFAEGFQDYRNLSYVEYSVHQLLAQRVYGLVLGYEDVNDHEKLRHDPALALALEKLDFINSSEAVLAGKSTLNRLEYCPETILDQAHSRYQKIKPLASKIEKTFVDLFLRSYQTPPKKIILDLDVTDDPVHGHQEGALEELQRVIASKSLSTFENTVNFYLQISFSNQFVRNAGDRPS